MKLEKKKMDYMTVYALTLNRWQILLSFINREKLTEASEPFGGDLHQTAEHTKLKYPCTGCGKKN